MCFSNMVMWSVDSPPTFTLSLRRVVYLCRLRRTSTPSWRAIQGGAGGARSSSAHSYSSHNRRLQQQQQRRRRKKRRISKHRCSSRLLLLPPSTRTPSLLPPPTARFRFRSAPLSPRYIRRCSARCGRRRASPGPGWTGPASWLSSTRWTHCWWGKGGEGRSPQGGCVRHDRVLAVGCVRGEREE